MKKLQENSNAYGIDDLFKSVGKKYLDPEIKDDEDIRKISRIKINKKCINKGKKYVVKLIWYILMI